MTSGLFLYETLHVAFATLGALVTPLWFCPLMLDLLARNRLLAYILTSVTQNLKNLGVAYSFGIVVIYLYAVIGFYFFQGAFNFGGEGFDCSTLWGW